MFGAVLKNNKKKIFLAYALTICGYVAAQIYPLITGFAINGVLQKEYIAILWLCICHFTMVGLEVAAKMMDTRVFSKIHADFASDAINDAHNRGTPAPLIAGRASLLREYVIFLERDIPAAIFSVISIMVAVITLLWLDAKTCLACIILLVPATIINTNLAKKSVDINKGLNDRLEKEVALLQSNNRAGIKRHFQALSMWRIRLSDLEAKSYGTLELFVITLFGFALWRVATQNNVEAGTIYAIFSYIWRFVTSMDQIPQIIQQIAKLSDISRRLKQ